LKETAGKDDEVVMGENERRRVPKRRIGMRRCTSLGIAGSRRQHYVRKNAVMD